MNIKPELAQAIVNYLVTKPWQEVNGLIAAIQEAAKPQIPAPEIKNDGPDAS